MSVYAAYLVGFMISRGSEVIFLFILQQSVLNGFLVFRNGIYTIEKRILACMFVKDCMLFLVCMEISCSTDVMQISIPSATSITCYNIYLYLKIVYFMEKGIFFKIVNENKCK